MYVQCKEFVLPPPAPTMPPNPLLPSLSSSSSADRGAKRSSLLLLLAPGLWLGMVLGPTASPCSWVFWFMSTMGSSARAEACKVRSQSSCGAGAGDNTTIVSTVCTVLARCWVHCVPTPHSQLDLKNIQ